MTDLFEDKFFFPQIINIVKIIIFLKTRNCFFTWLTKQVINVLLQTVI